MENEEPIDNTLMICGSGILVSIFDKMCFTGGTGDESFHRCQDIVPKRRIITTFGESMKNFPERRTPDSGFRIIEWYFDTSRLKASSHLIREPGLLSHRWSYLWGSMSNNMRLYNIWLYNMRLYSLCLYTSRDTSIDGMSSNMP
jgi:hypothetical protein